MGPGRPQTRRIVTAAFSQRRKMLRNTLSAYRDTIDFEALDGQSVDLVFLLLAPEGAGADHLKALARVARLLRDPDVAHKLRDSRDVEALYAVLALPSASAA